MPRCRARGRFGSRDLSLVSFLSLLLSLLPLGLWSSAGDWVSGLTEAPWEQGGPAPAAGMRRGATTGTETGSPAPQHSLSWCPPQPCGGGREKDTVSWALSYVVLLRGTAAQVRLRQIANTEHRQISLAGALLPGPALPASHCSHLGPRKSLRGRILCAAALQQHPWPPRIPCPPVRVTPSPSLSVP